MNAATRVYFTVVGLLAMSALSGLLVYTIGEFLWLVWTHFFGAKR